MCLFTLSLQRVVGCLLHVSLLIRGSISGIRQQPLAFFFPMCASLARLRNATRTTQSTARRVHLPYYTGLSTYRVCPRRQQPRPSQQPRVLVLHCQASEHSCCCSLFAQILQPLSTSSLCFCIDFIIIIISISFTYYLFIRCILYKFHHKKILPPFGTIFSVQKILFICFILLLMSQEFVN